MDRGVEKVVVWVRECVEVGGCKIISALAWISATGHAGELRGAPQRSDPAK